MKLDRQQINEGRQRIFGRSDDQLIGFVCECADADCHRTVLLTRQHYEAARARGELILYPSHERAGEEPSSS